MPVYAAHFCWTRAQADVSRVPGVEVLDVRLTRVPMLRPFLAVVMEFTATMAMAGKKEPPIASRAAVRVLKHNNVTEPIPDAFSSRTEEMFATAIGTARDLRLRSGFLHGGLIRA